ncbi:MAG: virulence factor TspB C-terminal domain-related protein, partial [Pseudomonadota bacterium]
EPAEVEFPDEMDVQVQNWPEAPGLEGVELGTDTVNVGALDYSDVGGACPPSPSASVFGRQVVVNITPLCTFAGYIRPLVLIIAAISAANIVAGGLRS